MAIEKNPISKTIPSYSPLLTYLPNVWVLKSILIQESVIDFIPPYDKYIHFIPYGLLQTTDATTVKIITQQNRFLAQTGIVPILNITLDTMKSGLK